MQKLKDAFIRAGLLPKDTADNGKQPVKKSKAPKKELSKYHEHQVRTDCELCNNNTPDIEYYKHNNRLIVKRWLCIKCADEYKIGDELRETAQSTYAKTGRFRRMWGKTLEVKNIKK